ncbi:1-acyl-sn-glycerol-3-phosphate acyltransferase [Ruminococcaceae bacterium YRB3002]|nr:1-acyl-sn-glycerol-3-phosphate acyltransferase [Ruminococcaceae bacterium YRB3002]
MEQNKHKVHKGNGNTPDTPVRKIGNLLVSIWHGPRHVTILNGELLDQADPPYVVLCNHEAFTDFFYLDLLLNKAKPAYVVNEYYCTRPVAGSFLIHIGTIPKKLFKLEMSTPVRIMKTLSKGYPVVIYPEGRLSPDGRTNNIPVIGAGFYRRLGVDLVLLRCNGAYYSYPKWRKRRYRTPIELEVRKVIKKDELASMSNDELEEIILSSISNDADRKLMCRYPQKDKAEGLHDILYQCPECKALYKMKTKGNTISCSSCGRSYTLNDEYRFDGYPGTISGWYDLIKDNERKDIRKLDISTDVRTVIYGSDGKVRRKEEGICRLTFDEFTYESGGSGIRIAMNELYALPFSCGKEFETYIDDDLYYFYPVSDPCQVARWGLLVDIINEVRAEERRT